MEESALSAARQCCGPARPSPPRVTSCTQAGDSMSVRVGSGTPLAAEPSAPEPGDPSSPLRTASRCLRLCCPLPAAQPLHRVSAGLSTRSQSTPQSPKSAARGLAADAPSPWWGRSESPCLSCHGHERQHPPEPSYQCFSLLQQCRSSTGASLPAFGPLSSTPALRVGASLPAYYVISFSVISPRSTASLASSSSVIFPVPSSLPPHLRSSSAHIRRKSPFR